MPSMCAGRFDRQNGDLGLRTPCGREEYKTSVLTVKSDSRDTQSRVFSDLLQVVSGERKRCAANAPGAGHHISVLDIDSSGHIDWAATAVNRYDGAGVEVHA